MCELADFENLVLDKEHQAILEGELEWWHEAYLPAGNVVLDIGAGNGETAQFYLNHGAEKVICIEPNADLLYRNLGHDPRIIIIPYGIDKIKSDCEGGERNMVIEAHNFFILEYIKPSAILDRTTTCWKFRQIESLDRVMGRIPRHTGVRFNLHLLRIQIAHFIRRTLRGMF